MSKFRGVIDLLLTWVPMLIGWLFLLISIVVAAPVGDALERSAILTKHADRAVLLDAARAGQRLIAVGERGIIILSDDQGTSWRQVPAPVSVTLTGVRFADAEHGFIVGHGGTVLASEDGGEHWVRRLDGYQAAQLALQSAEATGDKKAIRAAKWLVKDGPDKPFLDLLAFDAQRLAVIGAYGLAFYSEDGGKSWSSWMERINNPDGFHLYTIRQRGDLILIAGEQGIVRLSEDAGQSFTPLKLPYQGSFFTAELLLEEEIVVAGLRGNVWHSMDAGETWQQLNVPMPASITASALAMDDKLILVNQAGVVLRRNADALIPLQLSHLPPLNDVLAKSDGSFLLLSINGVQSVDLESQP